MYFKVRMLGPAYLERDAPAAVANRSDDNAKQITDAAHSMLTIESVQAVTQTLRYF